MDKMPCLVHGQLHELCNVRVTLKVRLFMLNLNDVSKIRTYSPVKSTDFQDQTSSPLRYHAMFYYNLNHSRWQPKHQRLYKGVIMMSRIITVHKKTYIIKVLKMLCFVTKIIISLPKNFVNKDSLYNSKINPVGLKITLSF